MIANGQGDIEKLPVSVNTNEYDESSPVISQSGQRIFFTRTADPDFESTLVDGDVFLTSDVKDEKYIQQLSLVYSQIAGEEILNPVGSILNQDVWFAPIVNDTVMDAMHPGYPLNNALPNSLVSTGKNPDEYILINQFYKDGSMYSGFSRIRIDSTGAHDFPEPMHIYGFDLAGSDVNMTMTFNGHVLIISMNGPESEGEKDFYVSFYMRDNVWSMPVHMGHVINSPTQETSPFVSPDKRYLYFSSNRPEGLGGNDIYVSERLDYTWVNWTPPVLVKGDVNSASDDSHPYFDPARKYLYFTSRRDGSSDIYRQRLTPKPKLSKPIVIRGRIINSETGKMVRGEVFWGQQSSKGYLEYFHSYNGEFEVTLTEYEAYKFQLRKSNHTAQRILVDPRGIEKLGKDTLELVFYLDPKLAEEPEPEPIVYTMSRPEVRSAAAEPVETVSSFYDIFFFKGKAEMLRKSENALDLITESLIQNPGMEILIIGHTDDVGDEMALQDLSLRRAQAVKEHLVLHGISGARIQVSGIGAAQPMYANTSEPNREKNRRVEIKIVKP